MRSIKTSRTSIATKNKIAALPVPIIRLPILGSDLKIGTIPFLKKNSHPFAIPKKRSVAKRM